MKFLITLLLFALPVYSSVLLRVIEDELAPTITLSLTQHAADLRERGWEVRDVLVPRDRPKKPFAHRDIAQNIIWPLAKSSPGLHVFCIGRVPLPRSGFRQNPDGHNNSSGAYPCTAYYAYPSDGWTDVLNNSGYAPLGQFLNLPGDGIWDQDTIPGMISPQGYFVGKDASCAVGYLNLTPVANKNWNLGPDKSQWKAESYRRYFANLHKWHVGEHRVNTPFGAGHYQGQLLTTWTKMTDPAQTVWKSYLSPVNVETKVPFGAFFDFKAMPMNGDFWIKRTVPFSKWYLHWESFQTDWNTSRNLFPLASGSACTTPVGWQMNLAGSDIQTLGQMWMISLLRVGSTYLTLYGDPTVKLSR